MVRVALVVALGAVAGCSEGYRVEPLLSESSETARALISTYDDAEEIRKVEMLCTQFIERYNAGDCRSAWGMLAKDYRKRFLKAAGSDEGGEERLCEGYHLSGGVLVKVPAEAFLLGPRPHYITSVSPELKVGREGQERLFYVVQKNGTYRVLGVIEEGGKLFLNPR